MELSKILNKYSCYAFACFWLCLPAYSADSEPKLVASGFELPWSVEFLDANNVLVSERDGKIKQMDIATGSTKKITGVWPVWFSGQGGLLDLAVDPEHSSGDKWVYATYSKPSLDGASTALARFKVVDGKVAELEELFVSNAVFTSGRHFGSRIAFDDSVEGNTANSGYVFFTSGDRGVRESAQDLSSHAGTVLRLNKDGSIPRDNPFVGQPEAMPEIWSYGHRNPQGISFDYQTGNLWLIEHGPRGGDEINLVKKTANYGWPVISYGKEYWGPFDVGEGTHREGMEQPVKYYDPSIAPSSLLFHKGRLYSGALKLQHLNRVDVDAAGSTSNEVRLFGELKQRIRDVTAGPDGSIYFITDQGNLYQFVP